MVHSAYDSHLLIDKCPSKIESIASFKSKLIVGCTDGSLRIYVPESWMDKTLNCSMDIAGAFGLLKEPYVLEKNITGFSKKPVVSLQISESRNILISLSESISIHRFPNLETLFVISKSKGANMFCWDDRRGFLGFGRQKRVLIFRYDGARDLVEFKDFAVPDTVKSLAWCGENVCLGVRREYMILNSNTGILSEVFPFGRIAAPLIISLPSGELLLGKDNIGVFVDQNGKVLPEGRICWSEAPTSVVIHSNYAIARLPRHVEIRSLRVPYKLVQTIVLRDAHLLTESNGCVITVLNYSVYGLLPVPLGAQIIHLTASGDFEEALALCKLLPSEDSSLRVARESSIHIRYGHHLFQSRNYEDAMEHFLSSSVDISHVLSLYPSIVLPMMETLSVPEDSDFPNDAPYLKRDSSSIPDDSSLFQHTQADDKAGTESKKIFHNSLMALIKYLHKKRAVIFERATAERTAEVVSDVVTSYESNKSRNSGKSRNQNFIGSGAREKASILDTALIQALLLTGQSLAALDLAKGPNYCDIEICEEFLGQRNCPSVLLELYRCKEMHMDALNLLKQLVEESKSGHSNSELTQRFKPEMILEYLKPLCGTNHKLVLEFSIDVLESCPSQTIELFVSGNIPADMVHTYLKQHAPHLQSTYLELMLSMNENGFTPNLQNELMQIYLSEVLAWCADLKAQKKWNEKIYSQTRKKLLTSLENISGFNTEILLKRLPSDALFEERAILLGKLHQHHLALSLYVHKLHAPDMALAYCDRVHEDGYYRLPSRTTSNVYLILLQIYLNPKKSTKDFEQKIENIASHLSNVDQMYESNKAKGGRAGTKIAEIEGAQHTYTSSSSTDSSRSYDDVVEPSEEDGSIMLDEALDLLCKKWDRMNGAQALKLLPTETKLQNMISFLKPLMMQSSESHHNFSVIKNLRQCENLQVKGELYKLRRTSVKINMDSICSLCNKRMGTSAFAVYPNWKTLAHFVCFTDSKNIKATKGSPLGKRR